MLKFVSSYLALSYLAFSALVVAGLLQIIAARGEYAGLALVDYRKGPGWRRAVGPLLIVMGYAWFFGTRREIITPGPAGAELTVLFGGGVLLALVLTLAGAAVLRPYRARPIEGPPQADVHEVALGHGLVGRLHTSSPSPGPAPGVCLLPDPTDPPAVSARLATDMAAHGLTVLQVAWSAAADAQAAAAAGLASLRGLPTVDSGRLALVGIGSGGDLALCAASTDPRVRAVVALAPLIEARNGGWGLGLLHEMVYPEAVRWGLSGARRRLLGQLHTAEAAAGLAPRPALVVYGSREALVPLAEARALLSDTTEVRIVPGESRASLGMSPAVRGAIVQWLGERL